MSRLPLYQIVVFLHVASAAGLFAVLAVEWVSLRGLTRSRTYDQAREWAELVDLLMPVGLPTTLVVLVSGIYLATYAGFWAFGWVHWAAATYILVMLAGAVVGPRRNRLRSALGRDMGPLSQEMRTQLMDPLLRASWRWRAALLSGLLYIMTVRPESALLAIGAFGLIGLAWSVPLWGRRAPPTSH
jgi:hypothetical protein